MLLQQRPAASRRRCAGLAVDDVGAAPASRHLRPQPSSSEPPTARWPARVEYSTDLFDAGHGRAAGRAPAACCWTAVAADPDRPVGELRCCRRAERRAGGPASGTTPPAPCRAATRAPSCSRRRRARDPGRDRAGVPAARRLTLRASWTRAANRLARQLIGRGRRPGAAGGAGAAAHGRPGRGAARRCSRRAAPTCRSTRTTRPSGSRCCSTTPAPALVARPRLAAPRPAERARTLLLDDPDPRRAGRRADGDRRRRAAAPLRRRTPPTSSTPPARPAGPRAWWSSTASWSNLGASTAARLRGRGRARRCGSR